MECFSCKSKTHKAISCPLLHFKPDREKIIKSAQFSREQQRNQKKRRKEKCYIKAILCQSILNDVARQVQSDNQRLTLLYEEFDDEKQITPNKSNEKSAMIQNSEDKQKQVFDFQDESAQPTNTLRRQLVRKKQTLQDLGEIMQTNKKSKETKEKFRSIVKKISLMNEFVEKQVEDSQKRILCQYREHLRIIQFRKSKIQQIKYIYSNKTINELEFFELKLKMLLKTEFNIVLDAQKCYKYFKPKENLFQVLSRTKISMLHLNGNQTIEFTQNQLQILNCLKVIQNFSISLLYQVKMKCKSYQCKKLSN